MILWRHALRIIQAAGCHVDLVGEVGVRERQACAAAAAESARGLGARFECGRRARYEAQTGSWYGEPCDRRCAGNPSTEGTVSDRLMKRLAVRLVAHLAAETSTGQHTASSPDICRRWDVDG